MGYETVASTSESQSLLHHHSDEFKNKIKTRIINDSKRASYVFPIFTGIFLIIGLVLLILSFTLFKKKSVTSPYSKDNDNHTLVFIFAIVCLSMVPLFVCVGFCWHRALKKRQDIGNNLFEEGNYLYHFVFEEGERWKAFAEYKWNLRSKIMIFAYVISFVFVAFGALPFGLIMSDHKTSPGLAFAIGWTPFLGLGLFFFLLILSITQYQRFRKFRPDVHCVVLSRGAVYTLGLMRVLQHSTAYPSSLLMNLTSVKLERRKIGPFEDQAMLDIKGFTVNHKGHRIPIELESPVPEEAVQHLIRFVPEMAEPYGATISINYESLNQPFFAQQQKLEPQPILHPVNSIQLGDTPN